MSAPTVDPLDFPAELCSKPSALVGLYGLDNFSNPLHRSIWESFNKSNERSPVSFKLCSLTHCFPVGKPKRTSYEGYIPRGILKRNWMKKHLQEIPAAIAFLFELNWDDANWEELVFKCKSQLQGLRASLGNHTTKLAVILIQKVAPHPAAEDVKAADRAKELCAACEIDPKQLFVLPHGDHLQGYIVRLENALYDMAQNYYHQEIKYVKQHKDQLNKANHQYLCVRHQFKVAFLSELKQDNHNAKKHYESAYAFLKDVKISDTNIVEVKLIAGFINYKLCCTLFRLSQPRDAIGQFRTHIEYYKPKTGPEQLLFEHYSWLSKQYSAFGDIFDDAIRQGLFALQTQHPGFYYKLAAENAVERKLICARLCKDISAYPSADPLNGLESMKYFGQRPWRPEKLSTEPINPGLEHDGISALKFREKNIDHSSIIISLLGSAISQFKTYRCPRMRLELVVQMADEYFHAKDYGKALTLFSHMLWDYRNEKWWMLLSDLLSRALCCAYLSANTQDYIMFSLEALGPFVGFDVNSRKRIFNNLMTLLKLKTPEPEPALQSCDISSAEELWSVANFKPGVPISIDMTNMRTCVEVKARFVKEAFNVDDLITVEVFVRCSCPYSLELSHLSVVVNSPNYSSEFAVSAENSNLKFEPGIAKKLLCEFNCDPVHHWKDIQIGNILLTVGLPSERAAVLKFSGGFGSDGSSSDRLSSEFQRFRKTSTDVDFDKMECIGTARIVANDPKVRVEVRHNSPALLSEWYPIHVLVSNETKTTLGNSYLEISVDDSGFEQATQLCDKLPGGPVLSDLSIPLEEISQCTNRTVTFYLRGHRIGERNLKIKLFYAKHPHMQEAALVESYVVIPVLKPFEVSTEILSMKLEKIEKCFLHDPFILSPTVKILSPWPIIIHHSTLEPGLLVKSCDKEFSSHIAGTTLHEKECGTDMFAAKIEESGEQPVALGTYTLKWSRIDSREVTSSTITMPAVRCEPAVIGVEMSIPAHGRVSKSMTIEYRLFNHTPNLLQLDLFMDASDAFMFAGLKEGPLRLLPGLVRSIKYRLYPLFSGLVALPRLVLASPEHSEQIAQIIERNLPSHVYVMPEEKVNPSVVSL